MRLPIVGIVSQRFITAALSQLTIVAILLGFAATPAAAQSAAGSLRTLLESGRLPEERVGTVIKLVVQRGDESDLQYVFEQVLAPDAYPMPVRIDALNWLADAADTRKLKPAGDLTQLNTLIAPPAASHPAALTRGAIGLARSWQLEQAAEPLRDLITNPKTSPSLRKAALGRSRRWGKMPPARQWMN